MSKSKLIVVQSHEGLRQTKRNIKWYVPSQAATKAQDLNFTGKDEQGRMTWWDVTPPKTDYCHPHHALGKAYAFEFLDLIHNPDAEKSEHMFSFIACEIVRKRLSMPNESLYAGFFDVISQYLITGEVGR